MNRFLQFIRFEKRGLRVLKEEALLEMKHMLKKKGELAAMPALRNGEVILAQSVTSSRSLLSRQNALYRALRNHGCGKGERKWPVRN